MPHSEFRLNKHVTVAHELYEAMPKCPSAAGAMSKVSFIPSQCYQLPWLASIAQSAEIRLQ